MNPAAITYAVLAAISQPAGQPQDWVPPHIERTPAAALRTEGAESLTPGLEVVSFPGATFDKWGEVLARHNAQIVRNGSAWNSLVGYFSRLSPDQRLEAVNRVINRVPYVEDRQNWHSSDYWETPLELFQRGGDCEDYAIGKYLLLRQLGFESHQMEIAITKNHAFLIVRSSNGLVVLDNLHASPYKLRYKNIKNIVFTVNDSEWLTVISRHKTVRSNTPI